MTPETARLYEMIIEEPLADWWTSWFDGVELSACPEPTAGTRLVGLYTDRAALYGMLGRLRDLNLTLVSVRRLEDGPTAPPDAP
jgi:hypothetical protein